jgi:hypothetical protein
MFTELFGDLYKNGYTEFDYYGRIDLTLLTLFQIMTFDNFGEMAREVMDKYPLAWIPLILFAIITGFVIVNLIIAIICESLAGMDDTGIDALHGASDLLQSIHTRDGFPVRSLVPPSSNPEWNSSLRSSQKTIVSDLVDVNLLDINDSLEEMLKNQEELEKTVLELKALVLKLKSDLVQRDTTVDQTMKLHFHSSFGDL